MAETIFEHLEEFRLIDVEGVVFVAPNYRVIPEPTGFDKLMINITRDPEDRGGANFEFGSAESLLEFDRECGYEIIRDIIDAKAVDAKIKFQYGIIVNNVLDIKFEGDIIPSSFDEDDCETAFRVKRVDFGENVKTRNEIEIDIESTKDLADNEITSFDLDTIPLHSRTIEKEGIHNSLDPILFDEAGITGPFVEAIIWGEATFNQEEKSAENFVDNGDLFTEVSTGVLPEPGTDQERYVDFCGIVRDNLFKYKCVVANETVDVDIKHKFNVTVTLSAGGIQKYELSLFVVNGSTFKSKSVIETNDYLGASTANRDVDITHTETLNLVNGDEVYYGFRFFLATLPTISVLQLNGEEGYFTIDIESLSKASLCKGHFMYDVLNRLLQQAIAGEDIGEAKLNVQNHTGFLTFGEIITGATSKATAIAHSHTLIAGIDSVIQAVEIEGVFVDGEVITGSDSGETSTLLNLDYGQILKSTILEKTEQGQSSDGCSSLDFVTNGFAIRNFISPDYNNNKYYKKDAQVREAGINYIYINSTITKGNTPPNATFWEVLEDKKVRSAIKKLVDFVKWRYGAGIAITKQKGIGFGVTTNKRVTKVIIEKQSHFFQDKKIMTLPKIENPIVKKLNKELFFNEIDLGYNVFAKTSREDSVTGYNTTRKYSTGIKKVKKKLTMKPDVCTDGYEIERLRRLASKSETPTESDDNDDETFIIRCQRFNASNRILLSDNDGSPTVDDTNKIITLQGWILDSQISVGDDISLFFVFAALNETHTVTIDTIEYDLDTNTTIITTLDVFVITGGYTFSSFWFDVDIFLPERTEQVNSLNFSGVANRFTEYNLIHTPTNILVDNFGWYGSGLLKKASTEKVKFTSGKNNTILKKQYDNSLCDKISFVVSENQDFPLSTLRQFNSEIFGIYDYIITCNMTYDELVVFKEAFIDESESDINYGYVEFPDNDGVTIKGYPMVDVAVYNPLTLTVEITVWGKA